MDIKNMTVEQIDARIEEIRTAADTASAEEVEAMLEETRQLNARKAEMRDAEAQREELRKAVANGAGTVVRTFAPQKQENREIDTNSMEYRTAWCKYMQGKTLTADEQRAFTKANGAISSVTANAIMTSVKEHAPLLGHMTVLQTAAVTKYYIEGENSEATDHVENAVIKAASDGLTEIELSPAEITKLVQISDSAEKMSVPAFENWLTGALGEALAAKINNKIIAAMNAAAASAGTGITATSVLALLGKVKGNSVLVCNNNTLYTKVAPLEDKSKNSLVTFVNGVARIYGHEVLVDDHVAEGELLCGNMSKMVAALAEDVTVKKQYDIDTNSFKFLGVAIFDTKIGINSAFAKVTAGA